VIVTAPPGTFDWAHRFVRVSVPLSLGVAFLVGWGFVHHRTMVELVAVLLTTAPLLFSARARILFLVFGALLIFQSAPELTPPKLYYLFGVAVAGAGALARKGQFRDDPLRRDFAPLFAITRAFALLAVVSLFVSFAYHIPHKVWLRDVSSYLLFAAAPLFAYDAYTAFGQRGLRRLIVVAGLAGSAAFAAHWLSSRHIASIPNAFGLPTFLLGAALFAYAMAFVLEGDRQRLRWLMLASAILAGLIATGTRSSLILLAIPIAIILGARRHFARRSVRFAIVIPAAALLVLLGVQFLIRYTSAHRDVLQERVQLLRHSGSSSDQSYVDRLAQTTAAWKVFKSSPLLGVAPGYSFTWFDPTGNEKSSTVIDTPVEYLAKFGVFGLWPVLVLAVSVKRGLGRLRKRTGGATIGQLAVIGLAGAFLIWWALGVPFDDKGFAIGFLLLLALALSEASVVSRSQMTPRT
jgi:O-Antigen ligase